MEYDILTKLADFIGSQFKNYEIINEEMKEVYYTLDEIDKNIDKLNRLMNYFKRKVGNDDVSIVDLKNFQDEFTQNMHELKDGINYLIPLLNSLHSKNVLDLSKIDINETYKSLYNALNDLDDIENSMNTIFE